MASPLAVSPASSLAGRRDVLLPRVGAFVGSAVVVGGLAAANGGFFSSSWGWPLLGAAWLIAIAFGVKREIDALRRYAHAL